MIIYKVTNLKNNKVYIGQTINSMEYRKNQHFRDCNRKNYYNNVFHNALKKYDYCDFKWDTICICDNLNQLNLMEELFISVYNSTDRNFGYNLKKGGLNGGKCSDETKRKIGDTTIEKWKNPEIAYKMRSGLEKATQTWIEKSQLNIVERECPICHKIFKCKPYEKKVYCSCKCSGYSEVAISAIKKATEINIQNYKNSLPEKLEKIETWVKENVDLLKNVKMNRITFLNDLCKYLDVKDQRTVAKMLGLTSRKELVKKLIEISKNLCCTGPN